MNPVEITFDANASRVLSALDRLPAAVLDAVRSAVDDQNETTVGEIQAKRLGPWAPQPYPVAEGRLRHMSGRLQRSLRPSKARIAGDAVESSIGTNVVYAGVHEFGFDGQVTVKAHTRRRFRRSSTVDAVGLIFDMSTGRIRRGKAIRRVAVGEVQVRAHARQMHIPARAPIQRGISSAAPRYSAALSGAVLQAIARLENTA